MKRTLISAALALGLSTAAHAAPDNYSIDPSHTFSHWTLSHMGFSMQQGRFNNTSGKITLDMAAKSGSADISIDAASIDSGWAKRDEHLRGEDFFNTAKYPTLNFKSSKFQFKGDKLVAVDGQLTLLGVSKPVKLNVSHFHCGIHPMIPNKQWCGAAASTSIKRSDFGMSKYLPGVGDDVQIVIQVEAGKD